MIPVAEWTEEKGVLPSAPEVAQGKERFVTEALTETGIPLLVDRQVAGKEENEPLPPYEVLALTVPVSIDKFPIEAGASVWVEKKGEGASTFEEATFVELQNKTLTRFEKVKGEGFNEKIAKKHRQCFGVQRPSRHPHHLVIRTMCRYPRW